jgi:hypothetical protein
MPAPFHQVVAIIYVLRRLLICGSIAPVLSILLPIVFRILYKFLSLCVGRGGDSVDDRPIVVVVLMTVLFTRTLRLDILRFVLPNSMAVKPNLIAVQSSKSITSNTETTNQDTKLSTTIVEKQQRKVTVIETNDVNSTTRNVTTPSRIALRQNHIRSLAPMFVLSCILVRYVSFNGLLSTIVFPTGSSNILQKLFMPTFLCTARISFSMIVLGWMVASRYTGSTSISTYCCNSIF